MSGAEFGDGEEGDRCAGVWETRVVIGTDAERIMPELSRFFGIRVSMYQEHSSRHHRPHFHAVYQRSKVVVAVDTIEVLAGQLPRRQQRLLEGWAELHQTELLDAWQMLQSDQIPPAIEPLK